jgi:PKD repeat protein
MRLPWISRRPSQRAATRRKKAAPLRVRRLERRRVLDAAVADLVFAPADTVGSTAVYDTNEGTAVSVTGDASGSGALLFDWKVTKDAAVVHQSFSQTLNFTPLDDGNYTVTLTVTDSFQSSATRSEEMVVHNLRPVLVVADSQVTNEGTTLDLGAIGAPPLAVFIDEGILDTHTATVDWGDGSAIEVPTIFAANGSGALGGTHTYADNGVYTVTVTVTDDDGGTATDTFQVTVDNVAPTATLGNNGPVDEGSMATVTFTNQFDPSTADTTAGFRYAYDFNNDGAFDVGDGTYAGSTTSTSQMVSAALLAEGPGTRTVRAWIIDKDGGHTEYTTNITINNVAPTLINIAATDSTIDEGQTATIKMTIDDAGAMDVFAVEVNWKDGAPADTITGLGMVDASGTVGGTKYEWDAQARELTVSHLYPDDNPSVTSSDVYAVALTVRDDDLGVSPPYQVDVTVSNVRPVLVVAGDQSVDEGELLELTGMGSPVLAAFIDSGKQDTHAATVDWGDGSAIQIPTVNEMNGSGALGATHTYADNGVYTVTVTVTDDDGGTATQMFQVTVGNVAPTATLSNNGPVDEGSSATVSFTNQFDPSSADTLAGFRYAYDLNNDGTFDVGDGTYAGSVGTSSQAVSAALLAEGPGMHTVKGRIIDKNGGYTDYNTTITINNVAPELVNISVADATIDEGQTAQITMKIDDPGTLDTFEVDVNWQDGGGIDTITGLGAANSSGTVGDTAYEWNAATRELVVRHLYQDDNPSITSSDLYQVQLAVRDDDGGAGGPYQANITVSNVRPVLVVAANQNVNEGQVLDLSGVGAPVLGVFIDNGKQDTHTATVNWGDGSAVQVPTLVEATGSGAITATHTYADDGVYTVTVTVTDDDGGFHTQQFQVTVGNVAPTLSVTPSPTAINEGGSVSFDASFSDPGFDNPFNPGAEKAETFTYDINWGDGRDTVTGQAVADTNGSPGTPSTGVFNGSHTYADDGTYTVTVTIHDDDGGVHVQMFQVTVSNVNPTLVVTPSPTAINEGGAVSFDASFSDPGFDNPLNPGAEKAESFTYDINWGDGRDAVTGQAVADTNGSPGTPSSGMFNGSHTYADDGTYTVTVTIHDDDGGVHVQMFVVTVSNVNPTLVVTPSPTAINEGGSVSIDASFSDPGFDNPLNPGTEKAETFTYDVDWGDGRDAVTGQAVADTNGSPGTPSTGMFNGSHTYADDGVYTVTVTIHDDDGGVHVQTFEVTVSNVNPTLSVTPSPTSINEGGLVSFDASFSDPGFDNPLNPGAEKAESFTYDIDWGDGRDVVSGQAVADTNGAPGTPSNGMFNGSHTYADDGVYTVTVTIHDDDGGVHVQTFQVTVDNVAPTLVLPNGDQAVNEGQLLSLNNLATFNDPGFDNPLNPGAEKSESFTYDVDWGDGREAITGASIADTNGSPGVNSTGIIAGSHTYADDGTYTVTVTIHDDDGGSHTLTFEVTVSNVAPTLGVTPSTNAINEGQSVSFNANFSDPGFDNPLNPGAEKAESFTYDVDWGDGRDIVTGQAVTDNNGSPGTPSTGNFSGTHTYADNGTYTVTVTVYDDDGGKHIQTFTVVVANVAPTLVVTPSITSISEGQSVDFSAIFSDPGFDNPDNPGAEKAESFTFDVDWGDGRNAVNGQAVTDTNGSPGVNSTGNFTGSHIFADDGTYTVKIRIHDDDGGTHEQTFVVVVTNVAPSLTGTSNQVVNEGQVITLGSLGVGLTDPGFDNPNNPTAPPSGLQFTEEFAAHTINWGDGTTDVLNIANLDSDELDGPTTASFTSLNQLLNRMDHVYADNGTYTVTIRVADDNMGAFANASLFQSGTQGVDYVDLTFVIEVRNVVPTVTLPNGNLPSGGQVILESQTISLTNLGVVTDPGFNNPLNPLSQPGGSTEQFKYWVDWNDDGTFDSASAGDVTIDDVGGVEDLTDGSFDQSHTYADNGTYTVRVRIADDDMGAFGSLALFENGVAGADYVEVTFTIVVTNAGPAFTPQPNGGNFQGDEINTDGITTIRVAYNDPGYDNPLNTQAANGGEKVETFNHVVQWGDGTVDAIHQYTSGGSFTVTVTMTPTGGPAQQFTFNNFNSSNPVLTLVSSQQLNDPSVVAQVVTYTVNWGDGHTETFQLSLLNPGLPVASNGLTTLMTSTRASGDALTHTTGTAEVQHRYLGPPNPLNPTADIVISLTVYDDDGASVSDFIAVGNPGIQTINIAIDTTPDVARLDLTVQPMTVVFVADQKGGGQSLQIPDLRSGGGEVAATAERYLELRIVNPDGTESEGFKIKDEALADLRAFFKSLPDGKYRIYLIRTENDSARLVIEVDVRGGRVIDVSDDSEGTRDRPPTGEEESGEAATDAVPLEENPNLEQVDSSQGDAEIGSKEAGEIAAVAGEEEEHISSSPLLVSLSAAALAAEPWSRRVDEALANADQTAWQRLRRAGRSGRNGLRSHLPPSRKQRNAASLDYNRN